MTIRASSRARNTVPRHETALHEHRIRCTWPAVVHIRTHSPIKNNIIIWTESYFDGPFIAGRRERDSYYKVVCARGGNSVIGAFISADECSACGGGWANNWTVASPTDGLELKTVLAAEANTEHGQVCVCGSAFSRSTIIGCTVLFPITRSWSLHREHGNLWNIGFQVDNRNEQGGFENVPRRAAFLDHGPFSSPKNY